MLDKSKAKKVSFCLILGILLSFF